MAKDTEKRLIRILEFLKEPQGSTIPTLVKTLNNDQPQISLKRILQTLRGCQQNGIVKVMDGRVRLSQNMLGSSFKVTKDKNIGDQVSRCTTKRSNTQKPSLLSKLDEIHGKSTNTKSKISKLSNNVSDDERMPEFDDDASPPDSEGGDDPCQKKSKPKCPKRKPRCPKKKPKCPKKKPKCPKKKPKCPKKKPKCPKPKPKCPKPKPKCPKTKY